VLERKGRQSCLSRTQVRERDLLTGASLSAIYLHQIARGRGSLPDEDNVCSSFHVEVIGLAQSQDMENPQSPQKFTATPSSAMAAAFEASTEHAVSLSGA